MTLTPIKLFHKHSLSLQKWAQQVKTRGFTLVEVMIVMVLLGVVLTSLTSLLFSFTKKVSQENSRMEMREGLRNSLRTVEREIRNSAGVINSCPSSRCGGTTFTSNASVLVMAQPVFINDEPKSLDPTDINNNDIVVLRVLNNDLVMSRYTTTGSTYTDVHNQIKFRGLGTRNVLNGKINSTNFKVFSYFRGDGVEITTPNTNGHRANVIEIQLCGSNTQTYGQQSGGDIIECKVVDSRFLWKTYSSPTPPPTP